MMEKPEPTKIKGVYTFAPAAIADHRGFFLKAFNRDLWLAQGVAIDMREENQSRSAKNVVRGLHFQWDPPLGKLIRAPRGGVFAAFADIRKKSETFGQWIGVELNEENHKQVFAPPGIACGFLALRDTNDVQYLYTAPYNPGGESVIKWNDPRIGIRWPIDGTPILSARDEQAQTFEEWLKKPESDKF